MVVPTRTMHWMTRTAEVILAIFIVSRLVWSIILPSFLLVLILWVSRLRRVPRTVAFFHPFANDGGGGERVLWSAIQAIHRHYPWVVVVLYTGTNDLDKGPKQQQQQHNDGENTENTENTRPPRGPEEEELIASARNRFGIEITGTIRVVPLRSRALLNPKYYPVLTLFGQALGSIVVALECLFRFVPEVWVDTTGWAFPYPLVRISGARVAAYVHYPTLSRDMVERVQRGASLYNNRPMVARSKILTWGKTVYYRLLVALYAFCGRRAGVVMANSTWTKGHIDALWFRKSGREDDDDGGVGKKKKNDGFYVSPNVTKYGRKRNDNDAAKLVYPPCECEALFGQPLGGRDRDRPVILSIGQFRPEKDHRLQLEAFQQLKKLAKEGRENEGKETMTTTTMTTTTMTTTTMTREKWRAGESLLVIIGSTRNEDDRARLAELRRHAARLGLQEESEVLFLTNVSYGELRQWLGRAICGLHTMLDEHFGISIVEYMAAGAIPIAHASAGPLMDIVVPAANRRRDTTTKAQAIEEKEEEEEEEKKNHN